MLTPNNHPISTAPTTPTCMRPECRCQSLYILQHWLMLRNTYLSQGENNSFEYLYKTENDKERSERISEAELSYAIKQEREKPNEELPIATYITQVVTIYAYNNALPDESTVISTDYEPARVVILTQM